MPKVFIQTHGCQMNEYDSSRMLDLLQDTMQMSITEDAQQADLLLLNTCSIREKAQEKVFSLLGRWNKLKQNNPSTVIAVGGCVASQEGDALKQRAPMVDVVFGPQTLHRLPELIKTAQSGRKTVVDVSFPEIEKFDHLPIKKDASGSAFVSIMEGCSKYCTFCVVPYTRGDEISRPFDDVIAEVAELASLGVKEVNLLGQNVNAYRGQWEGGEYADLAILIQTVAQIDGIERIRFTTSHPVEFSDSLIDVYAEVPELVSHVHLPVQSGSDRILAAMKRGHTALEYKSKIRRLREVRPDISVSSDFIIGFPDETDADFEDTVNLIDQIGFDFSFSFIYSQRPGTPASYFEDNVPDEVKKQRLQIVQHKINDNAARISRMMVGGTQRILVDGKAKRQPEDKTIVELSGKTENNRSVTFSCPADQVDQLMGQFVEVHINDALINSLRGEWPGHSA